MPRCSQGQPVPKRSPLRDLASVWAVPRDLKSFLNLDAKDVQTYEKRGRRAWRLVRIPGGSAMKRFVTAMLIGGVCMSCAGDNQPGSSAFSHVAGELNSRR